MLKPRSGVILMNISVRGFQIGTKGWEEFQQLCCFSPKMTMKILQVLFILFHLSVTTYAGVAMTVTKTLVTVKEKESRRVQLIDDTAPILCSDTDGDNTRATLASLTPATQCFVLEPCASDATRYCLVFEPSQCDLDYNQATSYVATISCTDDKEPAVTGTVHIHLEANQPPAFQPVASGLFETIPVGTTRNKQIGAEIHTVSVSDNENDALFFSMYTSPPTDLFLIGYGSGVIRAKQDLRLLCFTPVSFYVSVWDSYHAPVGPKVFQMNFDKINDLPVIENTEQTIRIREDLPVNDVVLTVDCTDTFNDPQVTFEMTADPVGGLDIYKIEDDKVIVRRELDYEYEPLREITLNIRAFDGFCYSDYYSVRVIITDVDEDFQLSALKAVTSLDEGLLTYAPNITIWDQDTSETHHFARKSGNPALQVEGTTGLITSKGVYDVDPDESKSMGMKIEITDQASPPHIHVLEVDLTVWDINDNTPIFVRSVFSFKVDTCDEKGKFLGNVFASDDDSALNGNNKLVFRGSSTNFAVLSDGKVIYTALLNAGEVDTGSVYVTDQGSKPGPLAGVPASVTVECELCPTTTTAAGTTVTAPTTKFTVPKSARAKEVLRATDTSTNQNDLFSDNVGWIVAGAAIFLLLCVLLALVIYRAIDAARSNAIPGKAAKPAQAQQPRPPVGKGPNKATQQQSDQQGNGADPADTEQQQPQPLPQPLPQQQQPQPQPVTKPRAEIAAVTMLPPPLAYERVFINGQTPPAGNDATKSKPRDKTQKDSGRTQKEADFREQDRKKNKKAKAEKPKVEKVKAEPELAKPTAEFSRKPQMQIGEYIDLEVITPRNSPLPYVQ